MLVNRRECRLRLNNVQFEKRCETSQRKNEIGFNLRVSVWGDLPFIQRLSDETFDHCASIA